MSFSCCSRRKKRRFRRNKINTTVIIIEEKKKVLNKIISYHNFCRQWTISVAWSSKIFLYVLLSSCDFTMRVGTFSKDFVFTRYLQIQAYLKIAYDDTTHTYVYSGVPRGWDSKTSRPVTKEDLTRPYICVRYSILNQLGCPVLIM